MIDLFTIVYVMLLVENSKMSRRTRYGDGDSQTEPLNKLLVLEERKQIPSWVVVINRDKQRQFMKFGIVVRTEIKDMFS